MTLDFSSRRMFTPFVKDDQHSTPSIYKYTATVSLHSNEYLDSCWFSYTSDKKEKVIRDVVEYVAVETKHGEKLVPEMNGHMFTIRNGLLGMRTIYDTSHNRTHWPIVENLKHIRGSEVTVTLGIKQFTPQELKSLFSAQTNADLFDEPELFVLTHHEDKSEMKDTSTLQPTPVFKHEVKVPWLGQEGVKRFTISFRHCLEAMKKANLLSSIAQFWFHYDVLNIRTTSSMFKTLELVYKGQVVHSYSSPVQLQIIDKLYWPSFLSSNPNARATQEKFLTITLGNINVEDLLDCEVRFIIHDQFFIDYTNWVNNEKDKTKDIKDAAISVQFGFLV